MKKSIIKTTIWSLALLLFAAVASAKEPEAEQKPDKLSAERAAKVAVSEDRIAELLKRGNDPFRLSGNANTDLRSGSTSDVTGGMIGGSMDATRISHHIDVKGILCIRNKEPHALVQIEKSDPQLVRAGDLLLLPNTSRLRNKSTANRSTLEHAPKYLLVTAINKNCIMVAPRQRPQEQITIR